MQMVPTGIGPFIEHLWVTAAGPVSPSRETDKPQANPLQIVLSLFLVRSFVSLYNVVARYHLNIAASRNTWLLSIKR